MDSFDEITSLDETIETKEIETIKLTTKTKEYKVNKKYVIVSQTIKSLFEACPQGDTIPFEKMNIDDDTVSLIVEYMNEQKGRDCEFPRKPLRSKNLKENMTDINKGWLVDWIDKIDDNGKGRIKLYNLINASNCLNIQGLLHLACAKVASFVIDEPIENIPKIFGKDQDDVKEEHKEERKE